MKMQSEARVPERDEYEYEYRKAVAKNPPPGPSASLVDFHFTTRGRQPEKRPMPHQWTREPGIHQGTGDPPGNRGTTMEPKTTKSLGFKIE